MLVLSRNIGQRILIGNDMSVMVLDVQGGRVKLGFDCPLHVRVLREELRPLARPRRAPRELELVCCGEYL